MQVRELIQTPIEARFNRIARLTQRALGSGVAAISFINLEGEWFKAVTGWNVSALPRTQSLAALLMHGEGPVAVGDLLEAIADAGEMAQRELFLSDMGGIQQKLLEKLDASRRQALLDELTRLWNRRGGMLLLERALAGAGRYQESVGVCVIDIDDFKLINDRYGHAAGDEALREVAAIIVNSIRPNDIACRLAGDEFLVVIPDTTEEQLSAITKRVSNSVQSRIIRTRAGGLRVTVSVGGAVACVSRTASADELVHRADEAMYQAKRAKDELQPRLREA